MYKEVGYGILAPQKCGIWDMTPKKMWDMGYEVKSGMWDITIKNFQKWCLIDHTFQLIILLYQILPITMVI